MISGPQKTDATPISNFPRDPSVTRVLLSQCRLAGSTLQLQCDARSVELIVANVFIRTPHPTQKRCDQTTALLDA